MDGVIKIHVTSSFRSRIGSRGDLQTRSLNKSVVMMEIVKGRMASLAGFLYVCATSTQQVKLEVCVQIVHPISYFWGCNVD